MSKIEDKNDSQRGKKVNQKLKTYLVLRYFQKYSDENHPVKTDDVISYLKDLGIHSERRSIYEDIKEINIIMYMLEQDATYAEAEKAIEKYKKAKDDKHLYIIYDAKKKSLYSKKAYTFDELRLAAESIYASKFLTEREAKTLVKLICSFGSEFEAEQIKHDVFLLDRVKSSNQDTFRNVSIINQAMSKTIDEKKHVPEKISFKYLKHSISNLREQVERRKGEIYTVSPYSMLLNEGRYYLLAFDDKYQAMRTYRIDRMRDVQRIGIPREGEEAFYKMDVKTYPQRVFSMFGGDQERVSICFENKLLDTVIDRLGTGNDVRYRKTDDNHFTLVAQIEISRTFFAWLCTFGNQAKIVFPSRVAEEFKAYLEEMIKQY